MIRVGLIGAGFMGKTHVDVYNLLSLIQDVKLTGVCDINHERAKSAARYQNAAVFHCAEDMINCPDIDVIDICVPTYLHYKYTKMAMEAGKQVFVEKPVTISTREGEELIELQKKLKTKVMVGQCVRLWPSYVYLKKIYDSGKYGRLKRISLKRNSPFPAWGWENWYADDEKSGSAIFDLHIHDIDYLRYLMGTPEKIDCFGDKLHIKSILRYKGCLAEIENSWDFPKSFPFSTGFRADFEEATLQLNGRMIYIYERTGRIFQIEPDNDYSDERMGEKISSLGGYFYELKYFYDCLLEDKEIEIASLSEAVNSVKLIYREIERMNSDV